MRETIKQTLDTELSALSTSSLRREYLFQNAIGGEKMNKQTRTAFAPVRRVALLLAIMLAMTCAAGAAFYPQIVTWFAGRYGNEWGAWMEKGSIALPDSAVELNGAIYTVDEVLVRGRGLYVLGHINPLPGHMLVEQDCSAHDPFGYNIHYGEDAPEGTPTIYGKSVETKSAIHYVACDVQGIGVDGGAVLTPGSWGYGAQVQKDGSIVFSLEVEDGIVVEPGKEYTLVMRAVSYGVFEDGSVNYDDLAEKTWEVTAVPEAIQQAEAADAADADENNASADAVQVNTDNDEIEVSVPKEYLSTGTLPVYYAVERDFTSVVKPEWFNGTGIAQETEGKNNYNRVTFNNEAQLEWDKNSLYYNEYDGTAEVQYEYENGEKVMVPCPKPTMANAACKLAGWMLFGWPVTGEVYTLEQSSLPNISLDEAKQRAEALFEQLGMEGYTCYEAIDMSLPRIQEMGEKWNALIRDGHMLSNPVLDYSLATAEDEGYLLSYSRNGTDSELGGMFHADVYVTAKGFASINICDLYVNGEVYAVPDKLVDWQRVADKLPSELSQGRYPLTLDRILSAQLVQCPVRADKAGDGMVLTPVWVITFDAHDNDESYENAHAVFDAVDGHLINGDWL